MFALKQNDCVTLEKYIEKLEDLAYQLDLTSEPKLDILINGLDDNLRPTAIMKQFKSFENATEYLMLKDSVSTRNNNKLLLELNRKVEKLSNEMEKLSNLEQKLQVMSQRPQHLNNFGTPNYATTTDTMREISRLKTEIRQLKSNQRGPERDRSVGFANRSMRTMDGQPICFQCLRVGHISKYCNDTSNNNNYGNNNNNSIYSNNNNIYGNNNSAHRGPRISFPEDRFMGYRSQAFSKDQQQQTSYPRNDAKNGE